MPHFYTPAQRKLQAEFGTEARADRLQATMTDSIGTADAAFVESRNMFFLSTTDEHGFPSSSYKGGPAGFVRVVDGQTQVPILEHDAPILVRLTIHGEFRSEECVAIEEDRRETENRTVFLAELLDRLLGKFKVGIRFVLVRGPESKGFKKIVYRLA